MSCLALFLLPFYLVGLILTLGALGHFAVEQMVYWLPVPIVARTASSGARIVTYAYQAEGRPYQRTAQLPPREVERARSQGELAILYCRVLPRLSRAVHEPRTSLEWGTGAAVWDGMLVVFSLVLWLIVRSGISSDGNILARRFIGLPTPGS